MIYPFGDCEVDTVRFELRRGGERHHVEPQVFDVLLYLLEHRERVVSREELLAQVCARDPLQRMLFLETQHFLADHNLNYTDRAGMAVGVEIRVPQSLHRTFPTSCSDG